MSGRDATTSFAATLVDEWARAGLTEAVVAPGSRSTPLTLALARDGRFRVHVVVDERSAAFLALGIGLASGRPAVLVCTSGTAAAHFHPAVIEAHHARVPLLVCTANRPPELHDTGAGQTIDQAHLYGRAVRWFCAPGPPADLPGAGETWRSVASRAVAETLASPPGPVHLDLAFREPLVPTGEPLVDAPGRAGGLPWTVTTRGTLAPDEATVARVADLVASAPRGLLVAGWGSGVSPATAERFAAAAGWPLLADTISGARSGEHAVTAYEALVRAPGFGAAHSPDLVVRVGAPLTSKVTTQWLDPQVPQVLVDPDGAWLDPHRAASERLAVDAEVLLGAVAKRLGGTRASAWLDGWLAAERTARATIDSMLDASDEPFDGRVARDVVAALPEGAALLVSSSMPVRDVEWFGAARTGVRFFSNRGANGIDGLVSTTLGIAAAHPGPVIALLGDLAFLHDANGLLGAASRGLSATFVVVDNDGGGIFSFLPQQGLPELETLFATPTGADVAAIASAHGVEARRVARASEVPAALHDALAAGGVQVVVVPTDRASNAERHREVWGAVAVALG